MLKEYHASHHLPSIGSPLDALPMGLFMFHSCHPWFEVPVLIRDIRVIRGLSAAKPTFRVRLRQISCSTPVNARNETEIAYETNNRSSLLNG